MAAERKTPEQLVASVYWSLDSRPERAQEQLVAIIRADRDAERDHWAAALEKVQAERDEARTELASEWQKIDALPGITGGFKFASFSGAVAGVLRERDEAREESARLSGLLNQAVRELGEAIAAKQEMLAYEVKRDQQIDEATDRHARALEAVSLSLRREQEARRIAEDEATAAQGLADDERVAELEAQVAELEETTTKAMNTWAECNNAAVASRGRAEAAEAKLAKLQQNPTDLARDYWDAEDRAEKAEAEASKLREELGKVRGRAEEFHVIYCATHCFNEDGGPARDGEALDHTERCLSYTKQATTPPAGESPAKEWTCPPSVIAKADEE